MRKRKVKIEMDAGGYWITRGIELYIDGTLEGNEVTFEVVGR